MISKQKPFSRVAYSVQQVISVNFPLPFNHTNTYMATIWIMPHLAHCSTLIMLDAMKKQCYEGSKVYVNM